MSSILAGLHDAGEVEWRPALSANLVDDLAVDLAGFVIGQDSPGRRAIDGAIGGTAALESIRPADPANAHMIWCHLARMLVSFSQRAPTFFR
ncbi:MAG: hypothetical protein GY869_21645 [Planctomycetes bacterium]|nr:hypothetical protein [Planctomycetota bacterium]